MSELFAPVSYRQADHNQLQLVCNGCGTKGWKGKLIPTTMYGLNISEACDIHDWMYFKGRNNEDKAQADRVFLNNLLRIIDFNTVFKWLKWLRNRRANKYYLAVKYFGGPAFWDGKNTADDLVLQQPAHNWL